MDASTMYNVVRATDAVTGISDRNKATTSINKTATVLKYLSAPRTFWNAYVRDPIVTKIVTPSVVFAGRTVLPLVPVVPGVVTGALYFFDMIPDCVSQSIGSTAIKIIAYSPIIPVVHDIFEARLQVATKKITKLILTHMGQTLKAQVPNDLQADQKELSQYKLLSTLGDELDRAGRFNESDNRLYYSQPRHPLMMRIEAECDFIAKNLSDIQRSISDLIFTKATPPPVGFWGNALNGVITVVEAGFKLGNATSQVLVPRNRAKNIQDLVAKTLVEPALRATAQKGITQVVALIASSSFDYFITVPLCITVGEFAVGKMVGEVTDLTSMRTLHKISKLTPIVTFTYAVLPSTVKAGSAAYGVYKRSQQVNNLQMVLSSPRRDAAHAGYERYININNALSFAAIDAGHVALQAICPSFASEVSSVLLDKQLTAELVSSLTALGSLGSAYVRGQARHPAI